MKAVLYLFCMETKNTIVRALKKPTAIIGYAVMFVFYLLIGINMSNRDTSGTGSIISNEFLYVFLAAMALFLTFSFVYPGKESGIAGYRMADINLLFQAPVRTFDILVTLLLKQFLASFFSMAVLLIQIPMMKSVFGLSSDGVILYVTSSFAITVLGLILMILKVFLLRNSEKVKKAFKVILVVFLGIMLLYPVIPAISHPKPIEGYLEAFKSPYLDMVPFFGWMRALGVSPITGFTPGLIISIIILVLISIFGLFYLYKKTDTEWFEESVKVAEKSGIAAEAVKKGSMPTFGVIKRKKPIHYTFTGQGGVAILQKHLLEYRKTGFAFINLKSIFFFIVGGILGWLLSREVDEKIPFMVLSLLLLSLVSVLFSMFSRWNREARNPYFYLIPDTPFRKLIMTTAASALKHFIDGLCFFLPICILTGTSAIEMLLAVLSYTLLNQCFINTDILGNRIFGKLNASNFRFLLNNLLQLVLLVPAIGVSIALDVAKFPSVFSVLGYLGVTSVFYVTLSIYAAGVLRYPEYFE